MFILGGHVWISHAHVFFFFETCVSPHSFLRRFRSIMLHAIRSMQSIPVPKTQVRCMHVPLSGASTPLSFCPVHHYVYAPAHSQGCIASHTCVVVMCL